MVAGSPAFRGPVGVRPTGPVRVVPILPTSTTFAFAIPSFQITTTRSLLSDTDFATLGIVVTAQDGTQLSTYGPSTVSLGDVGNGGHWLGLLVTGIDVPAGASMKVSFTIMNKGSSQLKDKVVEDLNKVCEGIIGALAGGQLAGMSHTPSPTNDDPNPQPAQDAIPAWEAAVGAVLALGIMEAIDALFADCDGWVVTELLTITRSDLDQSTGDALWTWSTRYAGTDSAVGCGDN